ncbi:hypothetical protein J6590_101164 [Homalodisca vitripennis]|nr:hypothetical protein J6590_076890 [Homalodisca vitripennis]KAG8245694.1 hypothetical protein J6590_101164 [Homalodisca vitripennis]
MNYIKGSRTDCSLLTRDNYLYIRNKVRNGKVYLRCRLKTCECTAQWEPAGDRFTTTSPHNHAADPIDVEVLKLKAEIKSQASWDNRPFKKVFDEVCTK